MQIFDPKLTKKKKKKKTGFDIDSAIADPSGMSNNDTTENNKPDKENMEVDNTAPDEEEALDLESFGKKKKKKKKNFNLDDLDAALPETKKEVCTESFPLSNITLVCFATVIFILYFVKLLYK